MMMNSNPRNRYCLYFSRYLFKWASSFTLYKLV